MTGHLCHPGWEAKNGHLMPVACKPGDVWECDCGLQHIADPPPTVTAGQQLHVPVWRSMTRRERRRHARR